jgi:hypothetical protein
MIETTWIYGLLCPRLQKIRYVGASSQPVRRYRSHIAPSGRSTGGVAVQDWIQGLREEGLKPELVLLEEVDKAHHVREKRDSNRPYAFGPRSPEAVEAENRWMVRLINEGHPLTNAQLPAQISNPDEDLLNEAIQRGRDMFGES